MTIAEFCHKHRIAKSTFYKLQGRGLGPVVMQVLGAVRISPAADKAWVTRMEAGSSAVVPELAPEPSSRSDRHRDDEKTVLRRKKRRAKQRVAASVSKRREAGGLEISQTRRSKRRRHSKARKSFRH
jgi:hypothetical protein